MKIHIRQTDDWIAVYKDGKCVFNTHSCSLEEGLLAFGIDYTEEWQDPKTEWDDMSWFFVEELPDGT